MQTCVPMCACSLPGRHLLTELVTDTYIPNDTDMRSDSGRVQVL